MKKHWLWTIILSMGLVAPAFSGDMYVNGPVAGKWQRGTHVFVESAIFVEEGNELYVDEGVTIEFLTADQFTIKGHLQMQGSTLAPITLKPSSDWGGMLFNYDRDLSNWHILRHVVVEPTGLIAKRIVETDSVAIRIENCEFISQQNSIRINGGLIQASDNSFLTYGVSSKVVEIRNLNPFHTHLDSRSYLKRNLIQIDGASPHSVGSSINGAFGLYVRGSTDLIIRENAIQLWKVSATSTGIDFREVGDDDLEEWTVDSCVVKVVTEGYWACAVQSLPESQSHTINVTKSTFDIAIFDPVPSFHPYVLYASNGSSVVLNSSAIKARSSSGVNPVPYSVGLNEEPNVTIFVQYCVRWHEQVNSNSLTTGNPGDLRESRSLHGGVSDPLNDGGFDLLTDLPPGVSEYEVISDQNPGFVASGEEGIWANHDQVASYYGLLSDSPCREAGDPELDSESGDVPDAGRYDFIPTAIDDPIRSIPSEFMLARAYPNPFNPSTIIPFELAQSAHIQMTVYDILGRVADEILNGRLTTGQHYVEFNGTGLASGVYLLNVEYNGQFAGSQRLVLLK